MAHVSAHLGRMPGGTLWTLVVLALTAVVCGMASGARADAAVLVNPPFALDFSGDAGGFADKAGVGTGFTYLDQPSNGVGYIPQNLEVTGGELRITTTSGLAVGTVNTQDNALGVGVNPSSRPLLIETSLVAPPAGTGKFQQAGLWIGNDEDNFIKLVLSSTTTGSKVELAYESGAARVAGSTSPALTIPAGSELALRLRLDPADRSVVGAYRVGASGPFQSFGTLTASGEIFNFDQAGIDPAIGTRTFTGVYASHRNSSTPLVYRFDRFSIQPDESNGTGLPFTRTSFGVPFATSLAWGPDNRLYVTELQGKIHRITLSATKGVVSDDVITTLGTRLTLGITIDPASTPDNVIVWVSHSSPSTTNGTPNTSTITRLSGPSLTTRQDVITGLPRAIANHAVNSIHFGPDGRLYLAAGGNTGAGAPNSSDSEFGDMIEQPLSAALLVADVKAAGFDGTCGTVGTRDSQPCDVATVSTGLRNMYDFVHHSNGRIYGPENGLGVTGTFPPSPEPGPACKGVADPASYLSGGQNPGPQSDFLYLLEAGRYYGHPNPSRDQCVFKDGSYQGVAPLPNYSPPIADLGSNRSADSVIEYRGPAFGGALDHQLLIANYSRGDDIWRYKLSSDGRSVVESEQIATGFTDPLAMVEGPDGTVYVAEPGAAKVTALVPPEAEGTGSWTTRAPLPAELVDAGGAALGGRLYVVGGRTAAGAQSTVYAHDPATNSWSARAPLPGSAVGGPALAVLDGKLYAFGGSTGLFSGAVATARRYDPATNAWTILAPMPTARGGAAALAVGTTIHVVGGIGADGASLATHEVYDPAANTWTTAPAMGTRRDAAGLAEASGVIYVFGGRTRNADGTTPGPALSSVESFSAATGTWTARTPMPTGRRGMSVGTIGGRFQLVGGEGSGTASNAENEEYNPATGAWRTLAAMPAARHGAAAGTIDGLLYVAGGGPSAGATYSSTLQLFSLSATPPPPLPELTFSPGAASFSAPQGGAAPAPQTVSVQASGAQPATVSVTDDAAWLTATPASGQTPLAVQLSVDPAGLAPGAYTATVTASATGFTQATMTVTLTVSQAGVGTDRIKLSRSPDRSAAINLHGATVQGQAYIFVPTAGVTRVAFYLDNPTATGTAYRVETLAPFDMAGTGTDAAKSALPLPTTQLADGQHTVTAVIQSSTGSQTVTAQFTVANLNAPALSFTPASLTFSTPQGSVAPAAQSATIQASGSQAAAVTVIDSASWLTAAPASGPSPLAVQMSVDPSGLAPGTYTATVTASAPGFTQATMQVTLTVTAVGGGAGTDRIKLSLAPDRSAPVNLHGATVHGQIYVFVPKAGVTKVTFHVDDPTLQRTPYRIEGVSPFDLAGTANDTAKSALPFSTATLTVGQHTVTAVIQSSTGSETVTAQFGVTAG